MQRRRSCPVRDNIMRRYDQELLGAPLWCMTQQEEGLWIQGVNVVVPQRRVFVYDRSGWRVGLLQCSRSLKEPGNSEDKAEGETSVESLIPCSHGGRGLVIKGTEDVEYAEATPSTKTGRKGRGQETS
ncbi:hypothetical protein BHE74_00019352 [Ensete ventricosum]|nr:hypothetical protein BHE74_00019352 [Ensete ventricosum]